MSFAIVSAFSSLHSVAMQYEPSRYSYSSLSGISFKLSNANFTASSKLSAFIFMVDVTVHSTGIV